MPTELHHRTALSLPAAIRRGFAFQSPTSIVALAVAASGLAVAIGTLGATLFNACSAGTCP